MRKWKLLSVATRVKTVTCKAVLIQMPYNSKYAGYYFWHSAKLYHNEYGSYISYNDDLVFKLKKDGYGRFNERTVVDIKEVTANEVVYAFQHDNYSREILPLMHIPEELEPLRNVEPLEELLDD